MESEACLTALLSDALENIRAKRISGLQACLRNRTPKGKEIAKPGELELEATLESERDLISHFSRFASETATALYNRLKANSQHGCVLCKPAEGSIKPTFPFHTPFEPQASGSSSSESSYVSCPEEPFEDPFSGTIIYPANSLAECSKSRSSFRSRDPSSIDQSHTSTSTGSTSLKDFPILKESVKRSSRTELSTVRDPGFEASRTLAEQLAADVPQKFEYILNWEEDQQKWHQDRNGEAGIHVQYENQYRHVEDSERRDLEAAARLAEAWMNEDKLRLPEYHQGRTIVEQCEKFSRDEEAAKDLDSTEGHDEVELKRLRAQAVEALQQWDAAGSGASSENENSESGQLVSPALESFGNTSTSSQDTPGSSLNAIWSRYSSDESFLDLPTELLLELQANNDAVVALQEEARAVAAQEDQLELQRIEESFSNEPWNAVAMEDSFEEALRIAKAEEERELQLTRDEIARHLEEWNAQDREAAERFQAEEDNEASKLRNDAVRAQQAQAAWDAEIKESAARQRREAAEVQQRLERQEAEERERQEAEEREQQEARERERRREEEERARQEAEKRERQEARERERRREEEERARRERERDCAVCMEPFEKAGMCALTCKHHYCRDCIQETINSNLKSRTPLKCCQRTVPATSIQAFLPTNLSSAYDLLLQERNTPHPLYCAAISCGHWIPPALIHANEGVCSRCRARTCSACRQPAHAGICLQDTNGQRLMRLAESKDWQACPRCRALVERNEGCLHITCRCGYDFCYRCGKNWSVCQSKCR